MDSELIYALKVSGVGIVVLLLVLILLALIVSLMTKFIVDKPEKESETQEAEPEVTAVLEKNSNLETIAAIALALYRAQTEVQPSESTLPSGEVNSWRQFNLQRRLNQSSTIRRSR